MAEKCGTCLGAKGFQHGLDWSDCSRCHGTGVEPEAHPAMETHTPEAPTAWAYDQVCKAFHKSKQDAADLRAAWEWWEGINPLNKNTDEYSDTSAGWGATYSDHNGDHEACGPTRIDAILALWRRVVRP